MTPSAPLDELYAAPLAEFVATRDRLAATLTREGRKDEAQALKKLRRPSASAWATNQVVREARAAVEEMLAASDRLRRGQGALLAGRSDQAAYQVGVDELRAATAALGVAAREVLERAGRGARELVDGVIANVRVAGLADERRVELREARLTADLEAGEDQGLAGFLAAGAALGSHLRLVPPAPKATASDSPPDAEAARREKEEREAHARRIAAARAESTTAREVAARAEAAAQKARAARDAAAARLGEAERAAAAAREGDAAAQAALAEAERHLAAVTAEAQAAARRLDALGERR